MRRQVRRIPISGRKTSKKIAASERASLSLFAACLPGLEPLLLNELVPLGAGRSEIVPGGVRFVGDRSVLYRANLCTGLATQILVRLGKFRAVHVAQLHQRAAEQPWETLFQSGQKCAVRAVCKKSKLYHSRAVAERVAKAIQERTGAEAVPTSGAGSELPLVLVRVIQDMVTLSLDSSGEPLHRRGWRGQTGKAPLRSDLARALLLAAGWNGRTMLLDPMMGSGTLLIEAATLARRLAPGRLRSFAFEKTALLDSDLYGCVLSKAAETALPRSKVSLLGSDRDAGALEAARSNAERAGVLEDLHLECAPLSRAPVLRGEPAPDEVGCLATNPPHGRRVGAPEKLRPLYQTLGRLGATLPSGWSAALCVADRRLALSTGWPLRTGFLTSHGGVKIRALVGKMSAPADTPDESPPVL
ncbi:MAG: THUMP domain-containing protein [Planctomycetota bacterium]